MWFKKKQKEEDAARQENAKNAAKRNQLLEEVMASLKKTYTYMETDRFVPELFESNGCYGFQIMYKDRVVATITHHDNNLEELLKEAKYTIKVKVPEYHQHRMALGEKYIKNTITYIPGYRKEIRKPDATYKLVKTLLGEDGGYTYKVQNNITNAVELLTHYDFCNQFVKQMIID